MLRFLLNFLLLFVVFTATSQQLDLSSYKYIVVSSKFDFVKERDGFQTSSLTKFLLKKKGFQVLLDTEIFPDDLSQDRCLALYASVLDDSNMFITRSKIELRDCFNKVLYTSKEGSSREKDYKRSYHEAIRNAFQSMKEVVYDYSPKNRITSNSKDSGPAKKKIKIDHALSEPKESKKTKPEDGKIQVIDYQNDGLMIIDPKRNETFTMLPSNRSNQYILISHNGVMYKSEEKWVVEFYKESKLISLSYRLEL